MFRRAFSTATSNVGTRQKKLLIVYHSFGMKTEHMAMAVERGALNGKRSLESDIQIVRKRCIDANADDVLSCSAILFGTSVHFGYMSGMMKDFLERIYYPCQEKVDALPYGVFVGCGTDGTGAIGSIERIVTGLKLKKVVEPIAVVGELTEAGKFCCDEF
jgi:multimeric flavodoxin WrbA